MDNLLPTLAAIAGLPQLLLVAGLVMVGIDLRNLYRLALAPKRPDKLRFYYIIPGLALFAFGWELLMLKPL
ncbi:MAG: hypothetical protein A2600_01620 [Candidatus Lambdaproteobacteria bacterium RIFOXYD1_FULL_56_27]|uniref:Uncharacterized protein n=1 Tax=Candidatus Lambdaproteobacteria bacterium RIFOXYD2_FULL_56_26 TaxID=1817773 RepID=A0A1F6GMX7_9PROT|nr:MAG: hypothetical protein A2557_12810 [Candidatus Lambdaproteobacteria bacterium RIFOXYD2_FULL_56_26]OGH05545.1 MAG: hypothetical protein A2426_04410 [Candidatus Lambdaproteobacteria bacterium RIFOXYC1_FULL_56_13]OGH08504.1 MAG: hypothetical protein A2600_01620 [Candidatus Lambdaproteobacteria bacterium RIFOXYD1_FULL_56_27]